MIAYIFLIALLNLGLGYAVAVYLCRNRTPALATDSEPAQQSSAEDAAPAPALPAAPPSSPDTPADAEPESVPPETDQVVAAGSDVS
jgi:hypothetical protein